MRVSSERRRSPVKVSSSSSRRPKATSCQLRRARARSPKAPAKAVRLWTIRLSGCASERAGRRALRKRMESGGERVAEAELRVVGEEAGDVTGDAPDEEGVDDRAGEDAQARPQARVGEEARVEEVARPGGGEVLAGRDQHVEEEDLDADLEGVEEVVVGKRRRGAEASE